MVLFEDIGYGGFQFPHFPFVRLIDLCYAKTLLAARIEEPIVLAEIPRFLGLQSD